LQAQAGAGREEFEFGAKLYEHGRYEDSEKMLYMALDIAGAQLCRVWCRDMMTLSVYGDVSCHHASMGVPHGPWWMVMSARCCTNDRKLSATPERSITKLHVCYSLLIWQGAIGYALQLRQCIAPSSQVATSASADPCNTR
jgi:hypothetical protein